MSGSSLPPDLAYGPWGDPVRVRVDPIPVALFARAVKDRNPLYASEAVALAAGLPGIVPPPTFTFVVGHGGALPDLQPGRSSRPGGPIRRRASRSSPSRRCRSSSPRADAFSASAPRDRAVWRGRASRLPAVGARRAARRARAS
ncbi:MAG: MaoC family dehydratase N-terminal domain-containing protein [Acidimicrobiia bacterium]